MATKDKKKGMEDGKSNPQSYEQICGELANIKAKNTGAIDRYVGLLDELKSLKDLTGDQIQFFFASVNELVEDAWASFLIKASTHASPNKQGNDYLIAREIVNCCHDILDSHGLPKEELINAATSFIETKDEAVIVSYLDWVEQFTPQEDTSGIEYQKITPHELACVALICFNYSFREFSPTSYETLIKIDRTIAEYFSEPVLKEHAGKTLANVLSARVWSSKKISELTYLYHGTSDTIRRLNKRINLLEEDKLALRNRNLALTEEIARWKADHAEHLSRIEALERKNAEYYEERTSAESMLEYERNKFERQMQNKEAGLAEQLADAIELELQGIRETIEYLNEDDQRRIRRRLQRIDNILEEFGGGETNAEYRN